MSSQHDVQRATDERWALEFRHPRGRITVTVGDGLSSPLVATCRDYRGCRWVYVWHDATGDGSPDIVEVMTVCAEHTTAEHATAEQPEAGP